MKDLKYLSAYLIPIMAILGIQLQGMWWYGTAIFAFGFIPLIESIAPTQTANLEEEERNSKLKNGVFDVMLYLNLPIVFGVFIFCMYTYAQGGLETYQVVGLVLTAGIVAGSNGINVAHELGHRHSWERFIGKALLLPSLYMHFFIEHNYGHHLNAATPEDPATARYNEPLYAFWVRSTISQYTSAWRIQMNLLKKQKQSFFSLNNDMFWYTIIQLFWIIGFGLIFSWMTAGIVVLSGVVGFLLLETINYIEHYGLVRDKRKSGRYVPVTEIHSWNSNHVIGRMVLYELTRHSDHHYRSTKKYQVLDYHDKSPQLPYGYPTCMLLATIPPLWFKLVNKHVPTQMKPLQNA